MTLVAVEPEHGADRAQWSEAARRHLAQLDVAHRVSSSTVDHVRRGDKLGPTNLYWLQLSPTPQQLRFHQLGIDGRPVGNCLTALLKGRGKPGVRSHQTGLNISPIASVYAITE